MYNMFCKRELTLVMITKFYLVHQFPPQIERKYKRIVEDRSTLKIIFSKKNGNTEHY